MNKLEALAIKKVVTELYESLDRYRAFSELHKLKDTDSGKAVWTPDTLFLKGMDMMRGVKAAMETLNAIKDNDPLNFK